MKSRSSSFLSSLGQCFGGLCRGGGVGDMHMLEEEEERVQRMMSNSAAQKQSKKSKMLSSSARRGQDLATLSNSSSAVDIEWDKHSEGGARPNRPLLTASNPCLHYRPAAQHSMCKAIRA